MVFTEKVVSKEVKHVGRILCVERWEVELPDGARADRDIVTHNGAAAIVPVDKALRVPMVRQYRAAVGRATLEIPAGKLDSPGEDPLACARRELREETGMLAGRMLPLMSVYSTPGFCTERLHIFLALDLAPSGGQELDEDEFLDVEWHPLRDLVRMALNGDLVDMKTVAAVLAADQRIREGVCP